MNIKYAKLFLNSFENVIYEIMNEKVNKEELYIKENRNNRGDVLVSIGVTGDVKGYLIIDMTESVAKHIASKMMFDMKVDEMNEMVQSAICELSNMIAGSVAVNFGKLGKKVNITTPNLYLGKNRDLEIYNKKIISIPIKVLDENINLRTNIL